MLHLLLSMYLSVAVVFGPALCCCSMDSLFSFAKAASACGHDGGCKSHSHHAKTRHDHHSDGGGHSHPAPSQEPKEAPAPCDHDPGDCPCGQHRETMAASQPSDGVIQRSIDSHHDLFETIAVSALSLASFEPDVASALRLSQIRPSGVYGREILRAYHKLQC